MSNVYQNAYCKFYIILVSLFFAKIVLCDKGKNKVIEKTVYAFEEIEFAWENILNQGNLKFFPTYDETNLFIDSMTRQFPEEIQRFQIGQSFQKRPIWAYRIGAFNNYIHPVKDTLFNTATNSCNYLKNDVNYHDLTQIFEKVYPENETQLPTTLITSLTHAREPLSLVVALYFFRRLLQVSHINIKPDMSQLSIFEILTSRYLLKNHHVIFVPFVNPDGYIAIEQSKNYYLRKNRRPACIVENNNEDNGIDLNRNFNMSFSHEHFCDSEEFGGPFPFSEPETQAVRCASDNFPIRIALNLHSFGNIWTHPFNCCNDTKLPPKLETFYEILGRAANVDIFERAPRTSVLNYTVTGEAGDWMLANRAIIPIEPEVGLSFWPAQHEIKKSYMDFYPKLLSVIAATGVQLSGIIYLNSTNNDFSLSLMNHGASTLTAEARISVVAASSQFSEKLSLTMIPSTFHGVNPTKLETTFGYPWFNLTFWNFTKNAQYQKLKRKETNGYIIIPETVLSENLSFLKQSSKIVSSLKKQISPVSNNVNVIISVQTKNLCSLGWIQSSDIENKWIQVHLTNFERTKTYDTCYSLKTILDVDASSGNFILNGDGHVLSQKRLDYSKTAISITSSLVASSFLTLALALLVIFIATLRKLQEAERQKQNLFTTTENKFLRSFFVQTTSISHLMCCIPWCRTLHSRLKASQSIIYTKEALDIESRQSTNHEFFNENLKQKQQPTMRIVPKKQISKIRNIFRSKPMYKVRYQKIEFFPALNDPKSNLV